MELKKINLTKKAGDILIDLPPKQSKQIFTAIISLTKNSLPHDAKKLQSYDGLYRLDVGEYRVIYRFDTQIVSILLIGKRNDDEVYKHLRRLH